MSGAGRVPARRRRAPPHRGGIHDDDQGHVGGHRWPPLHLGERPRAGLPRAPAHVHDELVDSFYVLEGTLDLVVGEERVTLGTGGFACVLPGTRHTFSNSSDSRVRFLNINAPGGFEHYMRERAAAAGAGALTSERIGEIASRYDVRVVDQPAFIAPPALHAGRDRPVIRVRPRDLRVVVLLGKKAVRGWGRLGIDGLPVLEAPHPSPLVVNPRPAARGEIREVLCEALRIARA